ncbi:MAG: tyrosine-protein phosphatase [bacterium]
MGTVDAWIDEAKSFGIKSIICLLSEDQLQLYQQVPQGLIEYYRLKGFSVTHVPALDHQEPPLTEEHLTKIWDAYSRLDKPVLVHCSAGIDRTGRAITYIQKKLSAISLTGNIK